MPYADGTADDSKSRYMQLHNTIIRQVTALLARLLLTGNAAAVAMCAGTGQAVMNAHSSNFHHTPLRQLNLCCTLWPVSSCTESDVDAEPEAQKYELQTSLCCRALLVVPVSYEPSKLLRRSKDAVAIITGADLVVVKMSKTASDGGSNARMDATAAMGAAASNFSAADVAQATVLAQHDLNKVRM